MAKQTFTTGQVLTAAQMTSLQQTAMGGGSATAKTASYTLVAADAGTSVLMNSGSSTTITVNTALFAAGDSVYIQNIGAGVSTITAGTATVTTASSLALSQWEGGTLYFTSTSAAIWLKSAGTSATSGGMTLISETVASANSSISFSSISGLYKQLILVWSGIQHSATGSQFALRFNNDSTASAYQSEGVRVTTTTVAIAGNSANSLSSSAGGATIYTFGNSTDLDAGTQTLSNGYITIDNYASSTKWKVAEANYAYYDDLASTYHAVNCNFVWQNTAAITSLDIVRLAGTATISNVSNTTIRLYGVA
jgi:hypothetical protein